MYPKAHSVPSISDISAARLVVVLLLSPLVALPISAMAGCVVFLWLYTEILLGDKNDEGGMEYKSFLFVSQLWETFVLFSLRLKDIPALQ